MITDFLFEEVTLEVRDVCRNLGYSCKFNRKLLSISVPARLNGNGRQIITNTLISSICSISHVVLNNVALDADGCLYALFFIDNIDNGDTD